ncbi:MAG: branched-chain amino acid ABC transporter permease [Pseudomonadota bacterium]|nr:branched-chain amino acid ABC transporter permease [Pseudomonadota bacterium]
MTPDIAMILGQDGLINGAIYGLLAIALVVVYAVTRIIFIPQGELVVYAAFTFYALQNATLPPTLWLLGGLTAVAVAMDLIRWLRVRSDTSALRRVLFHTGAFAAAALLSLAALPLAEVRFVPVVMTIAVTAALGPVLYRVVYRPIASATVLHLLIVSVAVGLTMSGFGLLMFGPEGIRTDAILSGRFDLAGMLTSAQGALVVVVALLTMSALSAFFTLTLIGKSLRATSVSRMGARIVGIRTENAGMQSFLLAATIAGISGVLISPITTIYYDSGFLIGLKGFVGAIIGGLVSYPIAAADAIFVGLTEAFASFYASAYKETIVFALIIPVLVWRSLTSVHLEEDQGE